MLSLLMMLASDPATTVTTDGLKARLRDIREPQEQVQCHNGAVIQTADDGTTTTYRVAGQLPVWPSVRPAPMPATTVVSDLMFRSGDPVQSTLLLERSVDHCSAPISYEVSGPGSALPRFGHGN